MAKKKTVDDTQTPSPSAPARRRAPAKKQVAPGAVPATANAAAPAPAGGDNGRAEPSRAEIAEAAYFRHLNRAGRGGDEFSDWIEAERELKARHSR